MTHLPKAQNYRTQYYDKYRADFDTNNTQDFVDSDCFQCLVRKATFLPMQKVEIHLRGFANEFVMAIKGKNLSSHDKRWLTTPCTATLQNKRETFNTLFWTLRKSKIQSGELHSVTFNESGVSAMHTGPLRQRGTNLRLNQITCSDL